MAFLTGRCGKQHRSRQLELARTSQVGERHQRCESARVVADTWSLETHPSPTNAHRIARLEHRIQVRAKHDRVARRDMS